MGSRIAAAIILIAGIAALVWVTFSGGSNSETAGIPVAPGSTSEEIAIGSEDAPAAQSNETNEVTAPDPTPAPESALEEPENYGPRMDLVELDGWLNTDATSIDDFDGQVVLVEMWTFGCSNCKARIPYNQSYYEEFADESFEIVGVHAPEFSYEADVANIQQALVDLGVTWPVALDTAKKNFRAWQPGSTNYWPRTYVIDQNGDIRYDHIGEGKYDELHDTIRYLIENPPAPSTAP